MAGGTQDRFSHIEEDAPLPAGVRQALSGLNRFNHLEIGALEPRAPAAAAPAAGCLLCHHCGKPNEQERADCWACHELLRHGSQTPTRPDQPRPAQELTLVLDGFTYRSADPNVPEDIRFLMDRIRAEGYSPELLADWRSWRATRNSARSEAEDPDIKVFQGQRVSVIRIDGKVYTSDDQDLAPETRQLFDYLAKYGVTPALMDYLRQMGNKVKFRPADTACPSDGDLAFWNHVRSLPPRGRPPAAAMPAATAPGIARTLSLDITATRILWFIAAAVLYSLISLLSR